MDDSAFARILSLHDFETAARAHLPRPIFGYIAGAAEDNHSQRANRAAFDEFEFVTRVLVDVSNRTTATTLFGHSYSAPFGIAPLGLSALSAYRGDIVLAQAAARANVPMIMSGSSLIRLEEVAAVSPAAWFQAYLPGDAGKITTLIERMCAPGSAPWSSRSTLPSPPTAKTIVGPGSQHRCGRVCGSPGTASRILAGCSARS